MTACQKKTISNPLATKLRSVLARKKNSCKPPASALQNCAQYWPASVSQSSCTPQTKKRAFIASKRQQDRTDKRLTQQGHHFRAAFKLGEHLGAQSTMGQLRKLLQRGWPQQKIWSYLADHESVHRLDASRFPRSRRKSLTALQAIPLRLPREDLLRA